MTSCVGIVDWGIGGLDFYRKFKSAFPRVPVRYWSDAGFTPYGKLGETGLRDRLCFVLERLQSQGVTHCVVACNAASSALPLDIGVPCCGVIEPTVGAMLTRCDPADQVALLGGERTIRSLAYQAPLEQGGFEVIARVAQPLSALVEAGRLDGDEVARAVAEIAKPIADAPILVLACTHYIALWPELRKVVRARTVIDPAAETLNYVRGRWRFHVDGQAHDVLCTTGAPETMRDSALRAFGVRLGDVEQV